MNAIRVGVVGVGHLGRHHARILATLPGAQLVGVADSRAEQAHAIAGQLNVAAYTDYRELLGQVDAISIAVPTQLHRAVAAPFLERGIHTLIEKPLARSLAEAEELVSLARASNAILQVGHIERFNPTLQFWNEAGMRPRYLAAERLSTYTLRSTDIGVVLDLMIHDIDLVLSVVASEVVAVSAVGMPVFGGHEDVANARLWFEDGTIADLSASRASLHAVRKLRVWSEAGYAAFDFKTKTALVARPSPQLTRGDLGLENIDTTNMEAVKAHLFGKAIRLEQCDANADSREPLALELGDFIEAIQLARAPRVSGDDALRAMRVADMILQGIRTHPWGGINAPEAQGQGGMVDPPHGIPAPHVVRARTPRRSEAGSANGA